jgi:hypothetical protein
MAQSSRAPPRHVGAPAPKRQPIEGSHRYRADERMVKRVPPARDIDALLGPFAPRGQPVSSQRYGQAGADQVRDDLGPNYQQHRSDKGERSPSRQ